MTAEANLQEAADDISQAVTDLSAFVASVQGQKTTLEAAATQADGRASDAEAARGAAQSAQASAESARDAAQAAQAAAESARAAAAGSETASGASADSASADADRAEAAASAAASSALSVTSVREFGTDAARRQRALAKQDEGKPRCAVVLLLGQSLNAARGTVVAPRANASTFMFTGGAHLSAWSFWSTNQTFVAHWNEMASDAEYTEGGAGQTPGAGVGSAIVGAAYPRAHVCSVAIGARTLAALSQGGPLTNLYAAVERACALVRDAGYAPEVMAYVAHGEADAAAGTSRSDYYALASRYCRTVQLAAAQFMQKPGYVAPVVWTYPLQMSHGDADRRVQAAIREVVRDVPGVYSIGSAYQWPAEADRVHPTPVGYVQRGEAVGRALRLLAERGEAPQPLEVIDVEWDGGTEFTATFTGPVVRDAAGAGESLNAANAVDGLEWIDSGSFVEITSLSYEGFRIRGTLASAPLGAVGEQELRVGSQTTTAALSAGISNRNGTLIRAADAAWPSYIDHTYENRLWAAPQSFTDIREVT